MEARTTLQYRGPVVYRDGKVDMVLFPGGYATVDGTTVTFHYYTQDYLGNNRAVVKGATGAIEQTVAYYPYGAVIADLGTASTSGQPYKFGGKELTAESRGGPISRLVPLLIPAYDAMHQTAVFLNEQKSIFFMIFKHFRLQNCFNNISF